MSLQTKGQSSAIAYSRFFGKSNSKSKRMSNNQHSQSISRSNLPYPNKNGNSQIEQQETSQEHSNTDIFSAIMGTMKDTDYQYITKIRGRCQRNQKQKFSKEVLDQTHSKQQGQNIDFSKDGKQFEYGQLQGQQVSEYRPSEAYVQNLTPLKDISKQNSSKLNQNSHIKSNSHLNIKFCQKQDNMIYSHRQSTQNLQRGFMSQRERRNSDCIPKQRKFEKYACKTVKPALSAGIKENSGIFLQSLDKYMHRLNKNQDSQRKQQYLGSQTNVFLQTMPLKDAFRLHATNNKQLCEQTNSIISETIKQKGTICGKKSQVKYDQMNVQSLNNLLLAKQLQNRQTQVKQLKLQNHLLKNQCKKQNKKEQLMKLKMQEMLNHIKSLNYQLQRQKQIRKQAQHNLKQLKFQVMPMKQYRDFSRSGDFQITTQSEQDDSFNGFK